MRKFKNPHGNLYAFRGNEPQDFILKAAQDDVADSSYGAITIYKPASAGLTMVAPIISPPGFWADLRALGFVEVEPIYTPNSIRTFTGKVFDLKILDPESICIEDIAHALSHTARFGGHLKKHYSVAQHCVMGAWKIAPEHRLAFLLHDSPEAYIGDMPSPFKKMMPFYAEIEDKVMAVIAQVFKIQFPFDPEIKKVDKYMLDCEWSALVMEENDGITYWSAEEAERQFLQLYYETMKYLNR